MTDEWDAVPTWQGHPDRRRFAVITSGLSYVEAVRKAVSDLERGEWDDAVRPDLSRPQGLGAVLHDGDRTVRFLEGSPRGRDGTGKDLDETLRQVREWRDHLHATVRARRAMAIDVLRREVAGGLPELEEELRDEETIRWMIDDVTEELDLVLALRRRAGGPAVAGGSRRGGVRVQAAPRRVRRRSPGSRGGDPFGSTRRVVPVSMLTVVSRDAVVGPRQRPGPRQHAACILYGVPSATSPGNGYYIALLMDHS